MDCGCAPAAGVTPPATPSTTTTAPAGAGGGATIQSATQPAAAATSASVPAEPASTAQATVDAKAGGAEAQHDHAGRKQPAKAKQPAIDAKAGVLMIGDLLGVGTAPGLKSKLAGRKVSANVKGGRTLAEGMKIYKAQKHKPEVVEMGLFTNDDPKRIGPLKQAIETTIADARKRGGRVVWATIARPSVNGVSYKRANDLIKELAAKNSDVMKVVDWKAAVDKNPGLMGGDKVHGTPAGYAWRAKAFADAAKG